ncbi:hypothetical protein ACFL36_00505 [Thermodesulfobacteriota bacterium]
MPKKVVDWDIEGILELGVEAGLPVKFGRDFDLSSLAAEGFEAVFLGIGAWSRIMTARAGLSRFLAFCNARLIREAY